MPFYTPLRYPGGKRRLVPFVKTLLKLNGLRDIQYAEPYAGGAAIALALLFEEYAADVHINDLSRPVYAFWYSALNDTDGLCKRIESTDVSMKEWHKQRAIYDDRATASLDDLGLATLFLNRTNRSGIISGGVIGGKAQSGEWSLDVRFNKTELIQRIRKIGRYRSRIHLHQLDALQFTTSVVSNLGPKSFAFYDPPYIENGDGLYLNDYDLDGHKQVSVGVTSLTFPWVVTYDHAAVAARLYRFNRRIQYGLQYTAQGRYEGKEVMFLADNLLVPDEWQRGRTFQLSPLQSRRDEAVCGRMVDVKPHTEMAEGPSALERFRKAMKTIVAVPKDSVLPQRPKPRSKGKRPTRKSGSRSV